MFQDPKQRSIAIGVWIGSFSAGAVDVAAQLSAGTGAALLDVARGAFVHGMQLSSALAAIIAVGIAILAVVLLRSHGVHPAGSESEAPAEPVAQIATTQLEAAD